MVSLLDYEGKVRQVSNFRGMENGLKLEESIRELGLSTDKLFWSHPFHGLLFRVSLGIPPASEPLWLFPILNRVFFGSDPE